MTRLIASAVVDRGTPLAEANATALCWSAVAGAGLLCAYRIGKEMLSADGRLHLAASEDGNTWHPLESPLAGLVDDGWNHCGFQLASAGSTTILAAARMHHPAPDDTSYESGILDADTVIVRADGGHWEVPHTYDFRRHPDEWAIPCGRPLSLGEGRWVLPMERHARSDEDGWLRRYHAFAIYSDDDGRTWGRPTATINSSDGQQAYYDQRMVLCADGRLLTIAWVYDVVIDRSLAARAAYSEDRGRTWGTPFDMTLHHGPITPLRLPDDRLFAVYSRRVPPARILAATGSPDGTRWSDEQLIVWDEKTAASGGQWNPADEEGGDPLWDTMWGWTFGTPSPALTPHGDVFVAFFGADLEGTRGVRCVRLEP